MPIQNIGADIVQAFLAGRRIKLQQDALRQEQELAQQKFEQDNQQFQDRLKQQAEQFKLQQDLRNAQFKNTQFETRLKGSEALAKGYLSPDTSTEENVSIEIPDIGLLSAPNPETQRRKKIDEEIKKTVQLFQQQTPLVAERAGQVAQAQNPALLERTEAQQAGQLNNQKVIKDLESQEAEKRFKERVYLQDRRDANAMSRAQVRKSNEVDFVPEELNTVIDNLVNGATTFEEISRSNYTQKERKLFLDEMRRRGFKTINNQTKTSLQQMQAVRNILEQTKRLRDMIKADPIKSAIYGSNAQGLSGRIHAQLGTMASQVGGQKGAISQKDVDAMKAYVPSFINGVWSSNRNDEIVADFEKLVRDKQNSLMPGFSPTQKRILNETYELLPTHILTPKSQIKLDEWEDQ